MNTFYSRKSILLSIIIFGGILGIPGFLLITNFNQSALISILITWGVSLPIISTLWFGTRYIIKQRMLIVKIGPVKGWQINIDGIKSVDRSYNMLSSPANSLRRIKLKYQGGFILISPKYESEFVSRLLEINPKIAVGDLLT